MKSYNELTNEEKKERDEQRRKKQEYRASIPGVIETLEEELSEKQKELESLKARYAKYPDLKRHVNRWKTVRYCSASVNDKVTECDIAHNCGCCGDSPLEVWPYLETELGKLYSDPPRFTVGEKHWIAGDAPYAGWKEDFRKAGISEIIISQVSNHFKACAEERKQAVEEEAYEDED